MPRIVSALRSLGNGNRLLIVDDGSTDNSIPALQELSKQYREISFISLGRNSGKAAALRAGFVEALKSEAKLIAMMDADGQDDPGELGVLVQKINDGYDLVTGARLLRNDRFIKRGTSKIYNYFTAKISGVPGRDFNSGFKVMRSSVANDVRDMLYGELHRYLTVVAHWYGHKVTEVSVQHHQRLHGSSKYGVARFWRGFIDLITIKFIISFDNRPSHFFGGLGALSNNWHASIFLPIYNLAFGRTNRFPTTAYSRCSVYNCWNTADCVWTSGRAYCLRKKLIQAGKQLVPTRRGLSLGWIHGQSITGALVRTNLYSKLSILTLLGFGIFLATLNFLGVNSIGIQNDEAIHLARLANYLENGWYLPSNFLENGSPKSELASGRLNSYGPMWSLLTHIMNVSLGLETWGFPSRSLEAYEIRHAATVALALVASTALAYSLFIATRSALVSIATFTFLQAIPVWSGYSIFAIKDTPVAAGYTFFTSGLIILYFSAKKPRLTLLSSSLVAAGLVLAIGVRTAMWLPLTFTMLGFTVLVLIIKQTHAIRTIISLASAFVAAIFIILATGANHVSKPLEFFIDSVFYSADFGAWSGVTLTAGVLVPENPGPSYLPLWIFSSAPIAIIALALLAVTATTFQGVRLLTEHRRSNVSLANNRTIVPSALLGLQATGLPFAASLLDSMMYAGVRQHLYVFSAMAGLAGIGIIHLRAIFKSKKIVSVTAVLVVLLPVYDSVSLFPYQFIYKNAIASPVNDRWETDMHYVSAREAIRNVPSGQEVFCYRKRVAVDSETRIRSCTGDPQIKPFATEQGLDVEEIASNKSGSVITIARKYGGSAPALGCEEAGSVNRTLRGEVIVVSYVLICDPKIYNILERGE